MSERRNLDALGSFVGPRAVRTGLLSAFVLLSAASALPCQDRPLDWRAEERLRIGPALDGPEAFYRAYPWTIATDRAGRIYVLDAGHYVVRVFDEEGGHLREFGGRGGGPGAFVRPRGLAVLDDGTVVVADVGKGSLVRFDSVGTPIEQEPASFPLAPIAGLGNELLVAYGAPETFRLTRVAAGEQTTIAETGEREMITYPDCPTSVPGRPLFAPEVHWSAGGTRLAINSAPSYEIVVLEGGEPRRVIRRDVPAIEISRRDALDTQTARRGFRITWGDKWCKVSGDDLVDARGYAHALSPIGGLSVRPNGEVWASRQLELDGPKRIDVFGPAGRYLGTLPAEFPFPIAWQSEDQFLTFGFSDVGIPFVVGLHLVEEGRSE